MDLPIILGHRGFKGKYPENSMMGFAKCFATGATNFETDLYLTTDNVIVINHDPSTKRTYQYPDGLECDLILTESSYHNDLKSLVNIETGEEFITFNRVLKWFIDYDSSNEGKFSIMLDIKGTNPKKIMKHIIMETLKVKNDLNYWLTHLQFGIWHIDFIKYVNQNDFFQSLYNDYKITEKFDIFHITGNWKLSMAYVSYNHYLDQTYGKERHLFKFTGVSLLYLLTWSTEFLTKFIPFAKLEGLKLYNWTINTTFQYDYFIKIVKSANIIEYAVLTDFPDLMQQHKLDQQQLPNQFISKPSVSMYQQLSNFLYKGLVSLVPSPTPDYKSFVDGEIIPPRRAPNPVAVFIFQTCQYLGVF